MTKVKTQTSNEDTPNVPTLKFFKKHPSINLPTFATEGSACFDLSYQPMQGLNEVKGFDAHNAPINRIIGTSGVFSIMPGERVLAPTGLIFDIPEGYSVRIHPRSGISLKKGITLPNCEGVIDWDYTDEFVIMLLNVTEEAYTVSPGDRLAQGELVKMLEYKLDETAFPPAQKTNRIGGHGSTGK